LGVVIDLHCHLLAGIDDGPKTLDDSLAIARAAERVGTRTIVATPHVNWRYPNTTEIIARGVAQLNERLAADGLALEVLAGAEIAMTRIGDIAPQELGKLALAGRGWLLVEPPFTPAASGLDTILLELQRQGHRILLAHPERCPAFHRDPGMLEALVQGGVLTSITAGSLVGRFGAEPRRFALALLRQGMAHNVASDAHDEINRGPGMASEIEQAGFGPLRDWLTCAVPQAIVSGDETVPTRPAVDLPDPMPLPHSRWRRRRPGRAEH
jgi:protein-tyrosine phosphatase